MQRGKRPIYEKPEQFFARTFPTYNLRQLCVNWQRITALFTIIDSHLRSCAKR